MKKLDPKKVLVAMSGGLDSSMTAAWFVENGFEVEGVHFWMHPNQKRQPLERARKVAEALGIKFSVEEVSEIFQKEVIGRFVGEYKANRTPSHCVFCNSRVKFAKLIKLADQRGAQWVATGHYANVLKRKDGIFALKKAIDPSKDQSYFLHRLGQKQLSRIIFPMGKFFKKEIKLLAQRKNQELKIWPKFESESQGICFFQFDQDLRDYLREKIKIRSGEIVDEKGRILGKHDGLEFYTMGQRKGLGLSGGPFYVIGKKPAKKQLVVTNNFAHPKLWSREIVFKNPNWMGKLPDPEKNYQIRIRHLGRLETGKVRLLKKNNKLWVAQMKKPQWAVAAGQALVVYNGKQVVGGGVIK